MAASLKTLLRLFVTTASAVALAGCLGGGGGSKTPSTSGTVNTGGQPAGGAVNRAPTITGQAVTTATATEAYDFQPSAADADGDPLQFQAQNKPGWASFDAATGRLSGTPTAADVGTYTNISIAVTDGKETTSLGAFTITVAALANGQVTLSWTAPTENADGTPLTDLAGYKIYYGRADNDLSTVLKVGVGITTVVIEGLSSGNWYFAMSSYNTANVESQKTNAISKTI
jgi:Putative Ig domain